MYSARERNGIYIPRDRYFEEEAEKKVLSFTRALLHILSYLPFESHGSFCSEAMNRTVHLLMFAMLVCTGYGGQD